jgi:chaperonin GroEL (HSP60 family)
LESTERTSGRDALRKNVQAAIALSGAVKSTLGPKGLDKLLVDDEGRNLVTNDGVTVLESAKVEHPAARMIINASSVQDRVARDGTTSTVIFCSEMLRNAWELVRQGVHPATIARGFAQANNEAIKIIDSIGITASKEQIIEAVKTSLSGKLNSKIIEHIAMMAITSAESIFDDRRADPTRVKIIQQNGGSALDSQLIAGLAIAKNKIHSEMPDRFGPGKILLIDGGIERRKPNLDAKLKITSTGMLDQFRESESKTLRKQIDNIIEIGCDILVLNEGVDEEVRQILADTGILAYRRVERSDLELLASSCGAKIVRNVGHATKEDLGDFKYTREELRGGVNYWILGAENGGATLIVRGSTTEILDEIQRCFDDALGVACQLLEKPILLPGAGATQVALARKMRRFAEGVPGREQLAIEAWADGLESIPRTLAANAGYDPIDSLLVLTASQTKHGDNMGLDLISGKPSCVIERGVLEPATITRQAISGATDAAISILRIDDVLWAQIDAEVPDEVQERLSGMGSE